MGQLKRYKDKLVNTTRHLDQVVYSGEQKKENYVSTCTTVEMQTEEKQANLRILTSREQAIRRNITITLHSCKKLSGAKPNHVYVLFLTKG